MPRTSGSALQLQNVGNCFVNWEANKSIVGDTSAVRSDGTLGDLASNCGDLKLMLITDPLLNCLYLAGAVGRYFFECTISILLLPIGKVEGSVFFLVC